MISSNIIEILSTESALIWAINNMDEWKEQCRAQKKLENEKYQLTRGKFYCIKPQLSGKTVTLYISDQSVYPVYCTKGEWDGTQEANVKIVNTDEKNNKTRDFQIELTFNCTKDIFQQEVGCVIISYRDIYDNECKSKLKVDFKDLYNYTRNVMFYNE